MVEQSDWIKCKDGAVKINHIAAVEKFSTERFGINIVLHLVGGQTILYKHLYKETDADEEYFKLMKLLKAHYEN